MEAPAVNRKTRYYRAHKDEEEFQERLRIARRNYYERNKEIERARALERYYKRKAVLLAGSVAAAESPESSGTEGA